MKRGSTAQQEEGNAARGRTHHSPKEREKGRGVSSLLLGSAAFLPPLGRAAAVFTPPVVVGMFFLWKPYGTRYN